MKIVFMGTPEFSSVVLEELIKSENEVLATVTQPDKAKDRGRKVQFSPVKELSLANDIICLQPEKVRGNADFYDSLKKLNPDAIVVAAYGKIIPKEILDLPKYGCINIHASLLPRLRGAAPIQHAIIDGEKETGITIMQMAEGLDTGDMLLRDKIEIGSLNYSELHDRLAQMGAGLIIKALRLIEEGKVKPEKQDDSLSTYANMIFKKDGAVDFGMGAEEIERLIRGFDPWPGAFCDMEENGQKVCLKLWKAKVIKENCKGTAGEILRVSPDGILIKCGKDSLLVTEIQVPGKKRVSVKDYLLGHEIKVGAVLTKTEN